MKILHIYKDYHPVLGGIENHMKTLAEAQVVAGHEVVVLVTNPSDLPTRAVINGVQVVRAWRLATVASTPLSVAMPLLLARQRADIHHLHFPYPVGEASQWLLGRKRPYVITYHSDVVKQQAILRLYRPLMQQVLRGAGQILPTSDRYVQSSDYLRPLAHLCTAVPLSVDLNTFGKALPLLPPVSVPTLLFVGQHRYYKGVNYLIEAMAYLAQKGVKARLLIGGDGPMRSEWEALAQRLGVVNEIQFLGRVGDDDLPRLYASADIFVLPASARSEAFGKVLLEAMATGLPCVTTELGTGTSFVVQDGVTGLVVPPREPKPLAEALITLLNDPEQRQQLGQAGQQRAAQEFTVARMVARVQTVYDMVLS